MNHSVSEPAAWRGSESLHVLNTPEIWVLLWSQSQNALHVERLSDMQKTNLEAFSDNRRLDYVALQIGSREAVDVASNAVRPICHAREDAHAARRERV
jgi:hypothetical protein